MKPAPKDWNAHVPIYHLSNGKGYPLCGVQEVGDCASGGVVPLEDDDVKCPRCIELAAVKP